MLVKTLFPLPLALLRLDCSCSKFQDDIWLLGGRRGGGMGKGKEDGELIEKEWGRELLL